MERVRIGFIGVGGIGGAHLRVTRNCADVVKIAAICDKNADIAQKAAEEYDVEFHTDYREMCRRGDIDAVVVALPHHLYGEVVCHALEAGLHVLQEKPFARTLSDARRVVDTAARTGRCLMVAGQNKFASSFIKGKEIMDSGALGKVFLTRAAIIYRWGNAINNRWSWRGKQELSGGVAVIDAGWHILDMLHWYRGMPSAVYASLGAMKAIPDSDYDVDEKAALILEYPDGGIGSVVSCYITLPSERRVTLHGVRGSLDVSGDSVTYILDGETREVSLPEQRFDPMTAQMRHFVETVHSGTQSPIAGPQRAYEVMQIVDAAYRSARSNTRVEPA